MLLLLQHPWGVSLGWEAAVAESLARLSCATSDSAQLQQELLPPTQTVPQWGRSAGLVSALFIKVTQREGENLTLILEQSPGGKGSNVQGYVVPLLYLSESFLNSEPEQTHSQGQKIQTKRIMEVMMCRASSLSSVENARVLISALSLH